MDVSIIGIFSNIYGINLVFILLLFLGFKLIFIFILYKIFPDLLNRSRVRDEKIYNDFFRNKTLIHSSTIIIFGSFMEELIFRLMPIGFVLSLSGSSIVLFITIIIFSILFGLAHGNWRNIFDNGLSGLIYSFLFITLIDDLEDNQNLMVAFCSCIAVHFTWNIICLFVLKIKYKTRESF